MKKLLLSATIILLAMASNAQKYDDVKKYLLLGSYDEAKKEVDKGMANAKFTSKPDAYILKAAVYSGVASQPKDAANAVQYREEAWAAYQKYKELQPGLDLVTEVPYKDGPLNLHTLYFNAGYKDYQDKKYADALSKFEKTVEISDMLIAKKILQVPMDTNSLILAGLTAEQSGNPEATAKYYGRLADSKVSGQGYEDIYRYMVRYYFGKKDMANFEKYKALGKELYPQSEFFTYDKTDFAVGLEETFDAKLKALDQVLATDPSNYKAALSLGQLIYDTLYSDKEGAKKPANSAELETRMVGAFKKAADAKPDDVLPNLYLGDFFIKQSSTIDEARTAHAADMKKRTKPGTAASKDDIAKRDALDKQYADAYDNARVPYEKAADIFSKKATLTNAEKQQYKNVAGYLGDIYTYKKTQAKGKPADLAKFTELEKKYNDLYGSIR